MDSLGPAEALDLVGGLTRISSPARKVLGAALGRGGPGDLSRSAGQGFITILIEFAGLVNGLGGHVQGRNLPRRGPFPGLVDGLGGHVQKHGLGRGGHRAVSPAIWQGFLMLTRYHNSPLHRLPRET